MRRFAAISTINDVDFRDAAFDESLALLRNAERDVSQVDVLGAGLSLCVPTLEDAECIRKSMRQSIFLYAGLGMLGLVTGGALAFWRQHVADDTGNAYWMVVAGTCSLSGFVFFILGALQERRVLRQIVVSRFGSQLPPGVVYLHIEDAATFERPKLLSEDAGILVLHRDVRCLQIEGISARYVIYGDDVLSIESRPSGKSHVVVLTYQIGSCKLALALKDQGFGSQLQSQLLHRCSLISKIRGAVRLACTLTQVTTKT